jgi:hypothetical protein
MPVLEPIPSRRLRRAGGRLPGVCHNRGRSWPSGRKGAGVVPLSSDPKARAAQLANLKASAPTTHGAHSEALIRPLAEAYLAELAEEFPAASERVLKVQARRLAKLDRLGVYLDAKGEIRHQRRGEVYPASALEEKVSAAFLAEHVRLEQLQRERADDGDADYFAAEAAALAPGEEEGSER